MPVPCTWLLPFDQRLDPFKGLPTGFENVKISLGPAFFIHTTKEVNSLVFDEWRVLLISVSPIIESVASLQVLSMINGASGVMRNGWHDCSLDGSFQPSMVLQMKSVDRACQSALLIEATLDN